MKKASILLLLFLSMGYLCAQSPVLLWAKGLGGASEDAGTAMAVDASGNPVSVGYFHGTSDLDPGTGVFNVTTNGFADVFISKLDANGNFLWGKSIGGTDFDNGLSVAVDPSGNIYVTGYYKGTVDFDPGTGAYPLTATGNADYFILKLDPTGNFIWAKSIGGSGNDYSYTIGIDPSGNVYTAGYFQNLVDFDPGIGFNYMSALSTYDIFLCKLDAGGNFIWAKQFGSAQAFSNSVFYNQCSVSFDNAGNVVLAGNFIGTGDFDPGPGNFTLTSAGGSDIFITKLDGFGNLIWAKRLGGGSEDYCFCVAIDANGNICTSGNFTGVSDFDPDGGYFPLSSIGSSDIFISKLSSSGSFQWAKKIGGSGADWGNAIKIDAAGNIYTTGYFTGTVDFDPGPSTFNLSPGMNNIEVFVNKVDPNGNHLSAISMGGSSADMATGLHIEPNMDIYVGGQFAGTADFDPGAGTYNVTSNGYNDVFVVKLYQFCIPTVTISANPNAPICPGAAVTFTATPINGGPSPSFQWQVNGVNAGTNSSTFTTSTLSNNDVVTVTLTSNAPCAQPTTANSNAITVTVTPTVAPSVAITASPNVAVCAGSPVSFVANPVNGGNNPSFQWKINGVNAGTNSANFSSVSLNNGDVVSVEMTSSLSCAVPSMANSNTIIMTVNPVLVPSVAVSQVPAGPICAGTSVSFTATPNNGGTPTYQWKINGVNAGTNSPVFTSNTLLNNDVVTVEMTSTATCASPLTVSSTAVTMVVNPILNPGVSITSTPAGATCAGTPITFNATPVNGGTIPMYQWTVNGVNAGANSASFTSSTLSNGDIVGVTLTSTASCLSVPTAAATIPVVINPLLTPGVNVLASPAGAICAGTSVTFTATPSNGGTSPVYQWKINGINTGTNSAVLTTSALNNGDVVTVQLTSNATCATPLTATSPGITMQVNPVVVPAVTVNASPSGAICPGTPVSFTAVPQNGGSPTYQWKINGVNVGTNSGNFNSSALINGDIVSVEMISTATCASPSTATAALTMVVTPQVTPAVSIVATPAAICPGQLITFTANSSGGGNTPSYQWKVNGNNVGTNAATYSSSSLVNGDAVTVVMTSTSACAVPATATSVPFNVVVNTPVTPSVSINASPSSPVCPGTAITFTATAVNGGSSPSYQWKLNGNNVGSNTSSYTSASLTNGDVITVEVTSNAICPSPATVVSVPVTAVIIPPVTPAVSITQQPVGPVCIGTMVSFTATPSNGGSNPAYQWKLNGVNVGSNSAIFNSSSLTDGDVITVELISGAPCASPVNVVSAPQTVIVNNTVIPSVSIVALPAGPVCAGTTVSFTATAVNGGINPTYQWKVNGNNVGTNAATYSSSSLVNGDEVTVVMTSTSACAVPATATSAPFNIVVNTPVTPSVSINALPSSPVCPGTAITFTATAVNGGSSPSYQWKLNGNNIGSNTSSYTSASLTNGDVITVEMTSNAICPSPATVVSVPVTAVIIPPVTPAVSITQQPAGPVCIGTMVSFTATPTNGGSNPAYQWKLNGVNVGSNSAIFNSSSLTDGDVITVELTSGAPCASPVNVVSVPQTVIVNNTVTPSVSIVALPAGPVCTGTTVSFTATAVSGGNTPSYQWKVNGNNVGINNASFNTNALNNGDIVSVEMTSASSCAVPALVNSNLITMQVNPLLTPAVTITGNPVNAVCPGVPISFTANAVNGGQAPNYQWKINGINAGINSSTFTSSALSNGDIISVELTSNESCAWPVSVNSNNVTVLINPLVVPAVTISTSQTSSICPGTAVTFNASAVNGGTSPTYQWKVNGMNTGTNSPGFTTSSLADGDIVSVEMTSNAACPSPSTVQSNGITIDVLTRVNPSIAIAASPAGPVCPGTTVTYTASYLHGGNSPVFQWKVNGVNTGSNNTTFSSSSLVNGDVVTVELTSSVACPAQNNVLSNAIVQAVNPVPIPAVSISMNATGAICPGKPVSFTAVSVNGGAAPSYQWKVNGINTGNNSSSFTSAAFTNGDVVAVELTSTAACAVPSTALSNPVTVTVTPAVIPAVTITSNNSGTLCTDSRITFNANPVNGGSNPTYKWKINGQVTGSSGSSFVLNKINDGDRVQVLLTSNATCAEPADANSNTIDLKVDWEKCPSNFYMPTGFTPNNDGRNDLLKPTIDGKLTSYRFSVFNRWGQKVFETTDVRKGWDGNLYGVQSDTNVFAWMVTYQFVGKQPESKKGTVVLIR